MTTTRLTQDRSLPTKLCSLDLGRRVLVTGNAGSGKSILAVALGARLNIPVFGLDAIVWQPRWRKTPEIEKRHRITALVSQPAWVIDGVSTQAVEAADTVIFLDVPRRVCYMRVAQRNVSYLFRSRPGLPEHCPEILIVPKLAKIIWTFHAHERPTILAEATRSEPTRSFVHVG